MRSATMDVTPTAVASLNIDRIILQLFVALFISLTGCFGIPHSPVVLSTSSDTGLLEILRHYLDNTIFNDRFSHDTLGVSLSKPVGIVSMLVDKGIHSVRHKNQSREESFKILLNNLSKLQQRGGAAVLNKVSETSKNAQASNKDGRRYLRDEMKNSHKFTQTWSKFLSEYMQLPQSYTNSISSPLNTIVQMELMLPLSEVLQKQLISSLRTADGNNNIHTFFSLLGKLMNYEVEDGDRKPGGKDVHASNVNKIKSWQRMEDDVHKESRPNNLNINALFVGKENDPVKHLVAPLNHLSDSINEESSGSEDNLFGTLYTKNSKRMVGNGNKHFYRVDNSEATEQRNEDPVRDIDSIEFPIRQTVKKMEVIMKKRDYQYDDLPPLEHVPEKISQAHQDEYKDADGDINSENRLTDHQESNIKAFVIKNTVNNADEKEYFDEQLSQELQPSIDALDDMTADVIRVVTSGKTPKDPEFWRNVSAYLDSFIYFRQTKPSLEGKKKHKFFRPTSRHGQWCVNENQYYCWNGGTCTYIEALDIRACRCFAGYTGSRCEMPDLGLHNSNNTEPER